MGKREINWLLEQLPEWEEEGILESAQTQRLRERYLPEGEKGDKLRVQPGVVAIGLVGALLIGGGVISIVAYNWENLSSQWRTVISFVPLLLGLILYAYVWRRRLDSLVWKESGSGVLMLFLGATISLFMNTNELGSTADVFLKPWLILSIPLLYVMNSSLAALIYMAGLLAWSGQTSKPEVMGFWFFLAGLIPHLIYNFSRPEEQVRKQLLAWGFMTVWTFGWFTAVPMRLSEYSMLGTSLWLSAFCLLSPMLFPGVRALWRQPFLLFGLGGVFILVLLCASGEDTPMYQWAQLLTFGDYPLWAALTNAVVLGLIFVSWLFLGWLHWRRGEVTWPNILLWMFPLFLAAYIPIAQGEGDHTAAMVLGNVYGGALGIAYLRQGVQTNSLASLNIGMLFVLALALSRFFDTDWSLGVKGVVFILLGAAFLAANLYIAKRR